MLGDAAANPGTMENMIKLALVCVLLVGCNDRGDVMMGPWPDAPPGTPGCTGVVYDWCANADQCASHQCHFFKDVNFTVCTQTCSADVPCPPDHNGTPAKCNNRGICKPAEPNVCTL
jgi:hypothetical protein